MSNPPLPNLESLARDLRQGNLRAQEILEIAFAARDASTDPIGPYKTWDPVAAREQALAADAALAAGMDAGPLHGLPISLKDLFGIQGWPTFAGTSMRLPSSWEQQGSVVKALRSQLAVIVGKTHMVELAFGGIGTNRHWGTPRNPWDSQKHRVPGGSSSGAAVSLCEGSALLAFGTDTAGSVRIPASMTGTVGLKTTCGRWPTDGIVPLSSSFDSVGLLARNVADAAFGFAAVEGRLFGEPRAIPVSARPLSRCCFGVPNRFFWNDLSPGIENAARQAIQKLESAGARLVSLDLEPAEEAYELFLQGGLAGVEVATFLAHELPKICNCLDPIVRDRIRAAETLPATEYLHRRKRFNALAKLAQEQLSSVDALLTPTVAISPPIVEDLDKDLDTYRRCNLLALRNTSIANVLHLCALSLPVGVDALGLPVGLQLMAVPGLDRELLGVALGVEEVLGYGS